MGLKNKIKDEKGVTSDKTEIKEIICGCYKQLHFYKLETIISNYNWLLRKKQKIWQH